MEKKLAEDKENYLYQPLRGCTDTVTFRPNNEDHFIEYLRWGAWWVHVKLDGPYTGELQILGQMITEMSRAIAHPEYWIIELALVPHLDTVGSGVWWRVYYSDAGDERVDLYKVAREQMGERVKEIMKKGHGIPHQHPAQHFR